MKGILTISYLFLMRDYRFRKHNVLEEFCDRRRVSISYTYFRCSFCVYASTVGRCMRYIELTTQRFYCGARPSWLSRQSAAIDSRGRKFRCSPTAMEFFSNHGLKKLHQLSAALLANNFISIVQASLRSKKEYQRTYRE